jgi:hypothetical protein
MIEAEVCHGLNDVLIFDGDTLLVTYFANDIGGDEADEFCESNLYQLKSSLVDHDLRLDRFERRHLIVKVERNLG